MAVAGFIVQLFKILIDWGIKLLGWLWQNVVLNAIKLIILVFFFLLIALATIALLLITAFLGLAFLPFLLILGGTVHFGLLSLGLKLHGSTFWLEGIFGWANSTFLGLNLPTLTIQLRLDAEVLASSTISLSESSSPNSNSMMLLHHSSASGISSPNQPFSSLDLGEGGAFTQKFSGDPVNSPQLEPRANRTLLCVHGFTGSSLQFADFATNTNFSDFYDNIIAVDYYYANNYTGNRIMAEYVDQNTPIGNIGNALAQYIIDHPEKFHETIDIVAHSMGGLVVRYMIKHKYPALVVAGYKIDDIALIATPNHGTWLTEPPIFLLGVGTVIGIILLYLNHLLGGLAFLLIGVIGSLIWTLIVGFFSGVQGEEMNVLFNPFLEYLNSPDETPYGIDDREVAYQHITWSTFRGHGYKLIKNFVLLINPFVLREHDGMVGGWSVPLEGAKNYGPYPRNHDELLWINDPKSASLFADLHTELTTLRLA